MHYCVRNLELRALAAEPAAPPGAPGVAGPPGTPGAGKMRPGFRSDLYPRPDTPAKPGKGRGRGFRSDIKLKK